MAQQIMIPGAASVAIKCKDGVVLGSDRRATWGYTVVNKSTRKVGHHLRLDIGSIEEVRR